MSVSILLVTVTLMLMLSVTTPPVASPVSVNWDTEEMDTVEKDSPVWVSSSPGLNWGTLTQ